MAYFKAIAGGEDAGIQAGQGEPLGLRIFWIERQGEGGLGQGDAIDKLLAVKETREICFDAQPVEGGEQEFLIFASVEAAVARDQSAQRIQSHFADIGSQVFPGQFSRQFLPEPDIKLPLALLVGGHAAEGQYRQYGKRHQMTKPKHMRL